MSTKKFGERTTALEVVDGVDLTGYEIIVTGGASGIGVETVRALAKAGARVIIAARDIKKAEEVADEIKKSTGNQKVEVEKLELDSLKSVNEFCERYLAKKRPLHILINNAGIMACPLSYTKDGFESQFGTNHIGHFALTLGLIPALKEAAKLTGKKSRVVSVSSLAHIWSDVHLDDVNFKNREYNPWTSYGQSKTANIYFSIALTKHYKDQGIVSNSLMPGAIITNLQRHMSEEDKAKFQFFDEHGNPNPRFKTPEQGASTTVWAAIAPDLEGVGGRYLENCDFSEFKSSFEEAMKDRKGYLEYAYDENKAMKLWDLSLEMINKFSKSN